MGPGKDEVYRSRGGTGLFVWVFCYTESYSPSWYNKYFYLYTNAGIIITYREQERDFILPFFPKIGSSVFPA